jgi:DHA3 family macrolide efflux protein-like MFS transporter
MPEDAAVTTHGGYTGAGSVRRLATAALLSGTGSSVAAIALSFYMYARTNSPFWVARTLQVTFGLNGVFAPVAGWIADRYDRRTVMITCDLLSAAAWTTLVFLHSPLPLLVGVFIAEVIGMPGGNAAGAAVPNLVEERGLAWAKGLMSAANTTARLAGPIAGGLLYVAGGVRLAFAVNAVSFLVSALLTVTVRARFHADADDEEPGAGGWLAGFRVVFHDRTMATLTIWWAISWLAVNAAYVADLPLTKHFHVGALGYSLIDAFFGAGLVLGSLLSRIIRPGTEWTWVKWTALGWLAGFGLVGVAPWFALVLVGQAVASFVDSFGTVAGMTVYQRRAPDAVRGRTLAALDLIGLTANVVGFGLAGFVVRAAGPQGYYLIAAAATLLGFALLCTVRTSDTTTVVDGAAVPVPAA